MSTCVLTYYYQPFRGTDMMLSSAARYYPIINACINGDFKGNGYSLQRQYETLLEITCFDKVIYADAGDSLFMHSVEVPEDYLLYAAEVNCWPNPVLAIQYPTTDSPWRFLNGGGCCGPRELMIEWYKRYDLDKLTGQVSAQQFQAIAFIQALKDGFPIKLDYQCAVFQTMYFCKATDFEITEKGVRNTHSRKFPAIFHGNGQVDMEWLYAIYEASKGQH